MSEELDQVPEYLPVGHLGHDGESTQTSDYSADSIQVLEGLEAVRVRPSMYIGDVNSKGLHHLVYEVVDNSIDEALAGFCKTIDVTIHADNSVTVTDDGRGIPTGLNQKENRSALEVVLTVLHAGGKFDKGSYKVSGGLHGVGVSCVNALSTRLVAEVYREGKIWRQEYSRGVPLADVVVTGETDRTGTTITFKPDETIFYVTEFKYDILAARLRELAYLNKGISLSLKDERVVEPGEDHCKQEVFYSEHGLSEFVEYLDANREKLIDDTIHITTEKGGVPVEIALRYNTEYKENIFSYVNNINTIEGGTHLAGFRRGLTQTLKTYADASGILNKEKEKIEISGDDFREGLTAIISVKVEEPQFEGQTKTKLGNTEVGTAVAQAVSATLANYLEEHPREARAIVDKVILAARARHAARKARELVQRKTVLSGSGLPGKLADCSDNNPEHCEVFLVEGDSAGGTAKQGRDRRFQAILPLRGKILNVEKAMYHRVWESEEIKIIFQALGVTIGTAEDSKAVNLEKIRYHKVVIMADADVDGAHIATLIMTLFFRYMRPVIESGYLYIATPPLYSVKKGKEQRYCWTDDQRLALIQEMGGGSEKDLTIQRYKGLGEMSKEQLWETTMNPDGRTLRQVTIENAAEADHIFSMLMGDDVPPRRQFIEQNATYATIDA
ncbi:MAG: DNA topoisomerase (ATP-hydrolyzing) subunit B [Odoribacteraceae bacterium]|jgi:DNA gyrase subunit B|nr:DNA topoisomerase (ATP-hydrolyzing) subunit B [Odoribacteraceae bacterium]